MRDPANFRQALIAAYRENPCQVLPNALWKSISWDQQFETRFTVEAGKVAQLVTFGPQQLMLYWSRDRSLSPLFPDSFAAFNFVLIHADYVPELSLDDFSQREPYFRLIHPMQEAPAIPLPEGFSFEAADPENEAGAVADFIARCYQELRPNPEMVQGWCKHPVFDPNLWVWVVDQSKNTPAGFGIAEFDSLINEGSLEWIQVLPEYRARGLGQRIVHELLKRLQGRAAFTTVAGRVDNRTHPERLYRRCGFMGQDLWWLLRR